MLPSLLQCFILQKGLLGPDPKKGKKKNVSGGKMPNLSLLEFCSASFLFPNFQSFTPESLLHFAWAELFSPALNWNSLRLCWLPMLNTWGGDNRHVRKKQSLRTEPSDVVNLAQDPYGNQTNRGRPTLSSDWQLPTVHSVHHVCAQPLMLMGLTGLAKTTDATCPGPL